MTIKAAFLQGGTFGQGFALIFSRRLDVKIEICSSRVTSNCSKMVDVLLCSTYDDQKRDFVFDLKDSGKIQRLTVPIPIPMKVTAKEFVQRLIHFHNLPCYLESGEGYWGRFGAGGCGGGAGRGMRGCFQLKKQGNISYLSTTG